MDQNIMEKWVEMQPFKGEVFDLDTNELDKLKCMPNL
jgi:hypothetical protein